MNTNFGGIITNDPSMYNYRSQKFEDPAEGEEALVAKFKKLYDELTTGFRNLEDEARWTVVDFV